MADRSSTVPNLLWLLCVLLLSAPTPGQTPTEKKLQTKANLTEETKVSEADSLEAQQRRVFAISLVISLADETRSYQDLALRPRVLARAADTLWEADTNAARVLFRRAWEAAEKGDAEEVTIKTKDSPPPMVMGLRRMSGRDLRSEVLSLVARRDRQLGEEFLSKMKAETEREARDSKGNGATQRSGDSWSSSEAESKRLLVARNLLEVGEIERALEFAGPALIHVTANSIGFLSTLRAKQADVADQRFAALLALAEFDPSSDANTASGLSSYAFTPGFYVTFFADGTSRWSQGESVKTTPPNLPPALRSRFIQVASAILLRPLPSPDQDFTSSGRTGKYMVIKRLLPIFDQYAPDTASALRAQVTDLTGEQSKTAAGDDSSLLTKGLQPEPTAGDALEKLQDRIDHARTSRDRDLIYADAAVTLADQGESRARDMADKIDSGDLHDQVRQYVDFEFVQRAIRKKEASESFRLAKAGQITHTLRAWAYTQSSRLLIDSERPRAVEFLEEAANEARRIDAADPDRARVLIGVATQFLTADRVRAWEIIGEAVKAANSGEKFTGENLQLTLSLLPMRGGIKVVKVSAEGFELAGVFRLLTKDDFYRSIDLAKSFKNEAPRATAILTVARTVLEK
jgi:hypothetical protein